MKKLSTSQLSQYLGVTKRTVQRRAIREGWEFEQQVGLGGVRKMYTFSNLPMDVQQKIVVSIVSKHEQQGLNYVPEKVTQSNIGSVFDFSNTPFIVFDKSSPGDWVSQHSFAHELDVAELDKAYIKVGLLVLARLYIFNFSLGKIKGFDQFCDLYNQRKLSLNEQIYSIVGSVSRITLLRWEKQQQALGDVHNVMAVGCDDEVLFDRDLHLMANEVLMVSPKITAKRLRQHFLTIFTDRRIPSERRLSLWLKQQMGTITK